MKSEDTSIRSAGRHGRVIYMNMKISISISLVIIVVKMVYKKMSARSQLVSDDAFRPSPIGSRLNTDILQCTHFTTEVMDLSSLTK